MHNLKGRFDAPRAAFDLPSVWWNDTSFKRVNLLILDQCHRKNWVHGHPHHCAHTATIEKDIASLRQRGVGSIRYKFWNYTTSRFANDPPDDVDVGKMESDKTRLLLYQMLRWKPEAHFYLKARTHIRLFRRAVCVVCPALTKTLTNSVSADPSSPQVDTDVILYPSRFLSMLRTLEAAAGTQQGMYFGHLLGGGSPQGCAGARTAYNPACLCTLGCRNAGQGGLGRAGGSEQPSARRVPWERAVDRQRAGTECRMR
jgi:hypothetical protein